MKIRTAKSDNAAVKSGSNSWPKSCRKNRQTDGFRGLFVRFGRDTRASMLPMVAASLIALTGATGLAVDSARLYYVKDVLQRSLDSAGLAAGHAMQVTDMTTDAKQFFAANMQAANAVAKATNMNVTVSTDNKLITLNASATVGTTFMSLFGFSDVTVTAQTEVSRETRGMELALVMDNTGSMAQNDKIGTMKTAAKNLVQAVYGNHETDPNLWVSVVPYVAAVNVGGDKYDWLSAAGKTKVDNDYLKTSWMGCLEARAGGEDETDTPPSLAPFEPYFWADTDYYETRYSWSKGYYKLYLDNNWIDDPNGNLVTINEVNNRSTALGPNRGCAQQIQPLVAEKTTILNAIDQMQPWPFGGTASNVGLVWGWRTLSPNWRGLWSGSPANLPLDYGTPFMDKVLVILTDGVNEFINQKAALGGSDYTAYGRIADFGFSNVSDARAELDTRFAATCSNIKAAGVIIYTITFGSSPDSSTQAAYSACATKPSFYFHAPTADSLSQAFETIGRQLSNLRLSK
ncbi:pilus assembly protein TadG-related protein [Kordiimonas marina]|uniref:pilus assembly protein TadG-related protein n=1 Tax=Kordiimonas marina TaxID=2872312 RepID=UPI001FF31963|nr:TadE/TadG family type IV pilus assembly protein [Kordiimonas marina]MCJ9428593.1 pilus assembly protein [Kordiimonas marina]